MSGGVFYTPALKIPLKVIVQGNVLPTDQVIWINAAQIRKCTVWSDKLKILDHAENLLRVAPCGPR